MRRATERPPLWLRAASFAGFVVTVLYVVLSIFPIIDVKSWWSFSLKISGVVVSLNLVGAAIYLAATRRRGVVTA